MRDGGDVGVVEGLDVGGSDGAEDGGDVGTIEGDSEGISHVPPSSPVPPKILKGPI